MAALYPSVPLANPTGGEVIHGQVGIDTSVAGVTTITNSPSAIIQWQNFNIAENEITRFIQQNGQSAVLNRIIGGDPSAILGQLISNGKVLLINPNGVVFGPNSMVDTQGLIASSLNLSNEDFLKGNYHFMAGNGAGDIRNEGIIRAGKDGNIVLIAPSIHNNGVLKTEGGKITLAAGQELVLTSLDDPSIRFQVKAPDNSVLNLGKLLSEGGAINVFAGSIKHSGDINADSVSVDAQGTIRLVAEQDITLSDASNTSANNNNGNAGDVHIESERGSVIVAGSVSAKADRQGQGGTIAILGKQVGLVDQAQANADGANGGGQILIGGDAHGTNPAIPNATTTYLGNSAKLNANALAQGNGGKVVVWADNTTRAYGQISATGGQESGDGGFVETSAQHLDTSGLQVDASAAKGNSGQWLLDPNDVLIDNQETDVHVKGNPNFETENDNAVVSRQSIETALNNGTSVTITTGTAGDNSQQGNITVASNITKTAGGDAALSLNAHNNIDINGHITASSGQLGLNLNPDQDGQNGGVSHINKALDLNSGILTLYGESSLPASITIKNADLYLPNESMARLDGILSNIGTVTVGDNASLSINRGSTINTLNIKGGLLTGDGGINVTDTFNFESGRLAGSGKFITGTETVTQLATAGTAYLDKNWTNFGTINWQGSGDLKQLSATPVTFINEASGIINIGEPSAASLIAETGIARHLPMDSFVNRGSVNITGSTVKILGGGIDTGNYQVNGTGALLFSNNSKVFNGAVINSSNPVMFNNGDYRFINNAIYHSPETVVDNALLAFSTGIPISLAKLTLNQATLAGSDAIAITENFNFYAGTLAGANTLTTASGSTSTLADAGTVYINKRWENYGFINWDGQADIGEGHAAFINEATGTFNISGTGMDDTLSIKAGRFDNFGTVNITDATLQLFSNGSDTGSYRPTATGQLQFRDGTRAFLSGAAIDSQTPVYFINGKNFFNAGAHYQTPETVIDHAEVAFNTGNLIMLDALTLTHSAILRGSDTIDIMSRFNFYSGLATGAGKLFTRSESSTLLYDSTALVNKTWDNYGTVSFTAPPATITPPHLPETPLPVRQWNNYGTINWTGPTLPANKLSQLVILNNEASGTFNIGNKEGSSFRELNVAAFNNRGKTHLSGGGLKIYGDGVDTGSYQVTGTGQLQFVNGNRLFNTGSSIISNNKVAFINGVDSFNLGAVYNAPSTLIDGATVTFAEDTVLNNLDLSGGLLKANRNLSVDGIFNWSGGTLASPGSLNFTNRFNYSGGVMAATGTVNIDDHGEQLQLPAMPSIVQLNARTTGGLKLTGDINASGNNTAIQLVSSKDFDNSNNANLSAENGRWLVYANSPATSQPGNLAAGFKHYGCQFGTACNDGFIVSTASGNGLLYGFIPILTVTPNSITSVYGDAVNFTPTYSGFIDGDTANTTGITGTAQYAIGGAISGSGRYSAGQHDVSYQSGLSNQLGYQFQDNRSSLNEWTITPRDLQINANPVEKLVGEHDPLLTYVTTGLLSGDNLTGALTRKSGEAVGYYPIKQGTLDAGGNYAVKFKGAKFEINPANHPIDEDELETEISTQQNSQLALSQQLDLLDEIEHHDHDHKETESAHGVHSEAMSEKTKSRKPQQCR